MEGRQYNRAVRIHKYVYEALMRLAWRGFACWLEQVHPEKKNHLEQMQELASDLHENVNKGTYDEILGHPIVHSTASLFQEYLNHLRHDNGALSSYWMSYVDMVGDLLLGLLRSSREGDWALHMSTIHAMIPWCFAYDKVNYARYLPVYYADMSNMSTQYPDIYNNFLDGRFSVQLGSNNPFVKISVDQTTEETVNKDTKTSGGVRKYSLNPNAVSRFYLTAEYRSAYLRQFRNMIGMIKSGLHHADLQKPRILKDEAAVTSVVETLDNWINPFAEDAQDIISLSTSIAATSDISNDLLKAQQFGEQSFQKFREDRLEKETPTIRFHDPIKKHKLKTFSDLTKKTRRTTVNGKDVILKADRKLFGQMILIAQTRKELSMKEVLCHPLGPLPWSLATTEGTLR
jgi:hypothetical protein